MVYKLLVVDDDKAIADTLKVRLEKAGYEVMVAFDGQEALDKAEQYSPDVILLDLMMPKLNGFEVLKEIRKRYTKKWIPVIILSAKTDLETIKESYGQEADHYLTKPCSMENVLSGIRTMISLIPLRKT